MGIIFPEKITNTHFLAVASWDLRNEDLANQQAHPALNRNETQFKGFGVSPHPLTVPTFYETERSRFLIASTVKTRTETASDSNMISATLWSHLTFIIVPAEFYGRLEINRHSGLWRLFGVSQSLALSGRELGGCYQTRFPTPIRDRRATTPPRSHLPPPPPH